MNMETNRPLGNGSTGVGDADTTSNIVSRHDEENCKNGSPTQPVKNGDIILHQTLSMDDRMSTSSRIIRNGSTTISPQSNKLLSWSLYLLLGGTILGLALPKNHNLPSRAWQVLSNVVGYTYFLAWSASFYPQIFLNYRRRTTRGLSVDFCVLNVLGYICYTIYTTNFYWNENVIRDYRDRISGGVNSEITVQGNDVAFAIHAVLMASITLSNWNLRYIRS